MYSLPDMPARQPPGHGGNRWSGSSSYHRNWLPSHARNNSGCPDDETDLVRRFMLQKIYNYLVQRHSYDIMAKRTHELAKCLEETLFQSADSKGEYMNQDVLASRIEVHLRRLTRHRQQSLRLMPSSFGETSLDSSSMVNSAAPTTCNAEVLLASDNAPFNGFISKDDQDVDCNMLGIRFPFSNRLTSECSTTANCVQSNMIPGSLFLSHGVSTSESNTISAMHALQKHVQSQYIVGQNDMITQIISYPNRTDVSFPSKDQTLEFHKDSINSALGNIDSNMVHVNGSDVSEKKLSQTRYCEPELPLDLYNQTGDAYEVRSTAPSMFGNQYGSTSCPMRLKNACNRNSLFPHMQCQSRLGSSLMPKYYSLPHPVDVVAIQPQIIDQSGNFVNCSLLPSDTSGQLSGYDIQYQPQQSYALGMPGTTTSVDVHKNVNETSFRNYAEYPQHSESQQQVNDPAPSLQLLEPPHSRDAYCILKNLNAKTEILKKNRALLSCLCHARSCPASAEGKCPFSNCINAKKLLSHITTNCKVANCSYPQCRNAKLLIMHFKQCKDPSCLVCVPVKNKFSQQRKMLHTPSGLSHLHCNTDYMSTAETSEDVQPLRKKTKIDLSEACIPIAEKPLSSVSTDCTSHSAECPRTLDDHCELIPPVKHEVKKLDSGSPVDCKDENPSHISQRDSKIDICPRDAPSVDTSENITHKNVKHEEELLQTSTKHAALPVVPEKESTSPPKINCVSLTELFTPEQVRQHIASLRQWDGQSKENADKKQAMEQSVNQNSCQLCAAEELNLEPMPVYCTQCGSRVRRHAVYYMLGTCETRFYFCTTCHTAIRGGNFVVYGRTFSKSELEKRKNDTPIHEPWVQCDKCQGWQHQVCALFNSRMNGEGQAKYTCPNCYVREIEQGDRSALPQTEFLGAKDLPRTNLSDHIERRLHRKLQEEDMQLKATTQGLVDEKVPGAGDLVVRVVLSADKKLEVKKNFLDAFQEHNYPTEFPYKSKVILLFQDIEGVDVCLFGMYVQEFGSDCDLPNQRCIYISYLDSVKYFRPDVKMVTGEARRTFVYHEVLIGYLEYCKNRGFTSCYIWACPPPKDEDYILYCHPEIQKTPKSDKLGKWYLSMLKKAAKEDIVVKITNLYDHFLISTGERKAKTTATRLPYFDGDYWPGAAEEKLQQLREGGDKAPSKRSASKKSFTKRSLRTTPHSDISDSASKDAFLIHEIGKAISPIKEQFIMVHLHHACTHCCMFIISGNCWLCKQCSNFWLCDKCYEEEQCRDESDRHPLHGRTKHLLHPVKILSMPSVTKDEDKIIESEIFDTRHAFLNLCQGNHYQFDTLRRAKHSSMMLLYHLHNPAVPTFVTVCNICHRDIEAGHGLRCEVCFEYEICSGCYKKHGDAVHSHKLTERSSAHLVQSKESRASQVRKMNDLIVHVSRCHSASCLYSDCRKVRWLFRHGTQCTKRAIKGCVSCKKMWYLLRIHSRACQDSKCIVPRCSDLQMHARRLEQQSESRRRAVVTEMSMQRTAGGCL
ncbi:unnamed protein product [Rhodiola kirilowii]